MLGKEIKRLKKLQAQYQARLDSIHDADATECAKKLFPNKEIHSFAGRQWDHELDRMFFELPF
jgi:hypothetical protein